MDEQVRLPEFTKQMADPVKHYAETMTQVMGKVTEEMSHFFNTRCQHLKEMATDLGQCRDPAKLMEVNLKWFTTTMQDYTEEGARMMSIMQEMARPMKEASEKTLHSFGRE